MAKIEELIEMAHDDGRSDAYVGAALRTQYLSDVKVMARDIALFDPVLTATRDVARYADDDPEDDGYVSVPLHLLAVLQLEIVNAEQKAKKFREELGYSSDPERFQIPKCDDLNRVWAADGCGMIDAELCTLIPDHSEYEGKPACELPPDSVVDVAWITNGSVARLHWDGQHLRNVDAYDQPLEGAMNPQFSANNFGPVIRIHKLGEVRPKTLGDRRNVAWQTPGGIVVWCNHTDQVFCQSFSGNVFVSAHTPESIIPHGWTCLGPIEGLKIGGVIYGEKE